jgi:dienelactone hydrolase
MNNVFITSNNFTFVNMRIRHLLCIACCFVVSLSFSQKLSTGPQVLTFFSDVDDTEQPYGLYLPKNFDESKVYPLVIMLHGAGSNHRLALRRVFGKSNAEGENDVEATRYFPEWKDIDFIVASPYARGTAGYQGVAEKDVYDVLTDVRKRFKIDEDRIYLTGLSMGGGGTLWIGMTRPDIWAAIAPVCPAPPQGTDELYVNALNLPSHFYHGDKDQAVPVTVSREWTKKLQALGATVEYDEYPGVNHDSWVNAYKDEAVFDWLSKFKRNLFPDRITFNSRQYKYNKAYWVSFDKFTPGTLATIDAKFAGSNQMEITTSGLEAFTLNLKGHPKYNANQPIKININGKPVKASTSDAISFSLTNGKWIAEKYKPGAVAKQSKLEGPIQDAFGSRHIYVYGTGENPDEAEMKRRMDIATQAANWSIYRGPFLNRIMFFPRVISDKDVRPSDLESSNLVLFGTAESNSVIAKYKDALPMELKSTDEGTGLLYIFPVNGHYVLINSGLHWWAGAQEQNYRFPPSFIDIPSLKDFVLFKGSVKNPIVDGYFDTTWSLPAEMKTKLSANGVVVK